MGLLPSNKNFEQAVAKRVAEVCEQIIAEMGAELHDDLAQQIFTLQLHLNLLDGAWENKAEADALLIKIRTEVDQLGPAVRRISRRLMPISLEQSLDKTLHALCQNMELPGRGHIHFENDGTPYALNPEREHFVCRIVQELIHNALRHSSAWHVWVRMLWQEHTIFIEVEDDGAALSKISEALKRLKNKNNTLRLRSDAIGARLYYTTGKKGLLARLNLETSTSPGSNNYKIPLRNA